MASLFGKSSLSPEWVGRFREIAKLNIYAQSTPVRLSGVVIEGYDLSGVKLSGAQFEKTEWKNITLKSGEFVNTKFVHTSFENVKFENVVLKDAVFEDVTFNESAFFQAQLQNVRFIRCQFSGTALQSLKASTISIEDSKLDDVSFFRSAIAVTVKGSHFDNVDMRGLVTPSSLSFEKSDLKEVKVDRSVLTFMRAVNSHVDATFERAKIDRVEFSNAELDVGLDESTLGTLIVHASKITTLRMNTAHIGKVSISACTQTRNLGFYESTIGEMEIAQSALNDLDLADVVVESLTIRDTQLFNDDFKKLRAKKFILENVSLDKKIDFTGAQVESLKAQNVSKRASLQLITTDSSVKFD